MTIVRNKFPSILPDSGKVKVALIGEAPGKDEEVAGEPFVGAAGRELDRWIQPFFIKSQCFVGNLSQERPPDNQLSNWFVDSKNTIPNERLQGWIDTLKQQLEELRPNIIIALGRHPTYILTGKDGITKQAGSVLPCILVPGLKVMACPHPAFVVRGLFDLRPIIRVWMKRAKAQSQFPEYKPPARDLVVDPPLETVLFELDRLMGAKELAFDIETIPNKPIPYNTWLRPDLKMIYTPDVLTCISFSDSKDWSISIPFSRYGGQNRWTREVEMEIWKKIAELLGREGPLKIAHNLMFDFLQLAGRKVFVAPPYYDTMSAHNRAYLDLSKKKLKKQRMMSLAFCTALYTEEPYYKEDFKDENKGDKWRGADKEFWLYNAKDSAVLHEIKAATWADLNEMGMAELFEREMRVFKPLACMGMQGIKRNPQIIADLTEFLENKDGTGRIQVLQKQLTDVVGYELNTKSSKQMQKFLYGELGLPVQFHKKTHKPTADEGAIAKLYQKTKNPILKQLTELTRLRGFKSNYLDAPIGVDNRSRTTYNQARTCTARISSSDAIIGEGKNLQTIPSRPRPGEDDYNRLIKDYKRSFVADDGYIIWKRDYIQAEAMVVAWMAEDLQQMSDFQNGIDIHCRTVEILYGCSYEDAVNGYRNGDPEWKMRRNLGKPVRHGFNYLLGENNLHGMFALMGMDIPTKDCRKMLQAMSSNVPAVLRWHAEIADTLKTTRTIVNPHGLRRTFLGVIDNDCLREAVAFGPQSTVGQLLNFSLERIYHTPGLMTQFDFLLQIHDAILGQSPVDKVQEHAEIIGQLMELPMTIKGRELVIPSDIEVGPDWGSLNKPTW